MEEKRCGEGLEMMMEENLSSPASSNTQSRRLKSMKGRMTSLYSSREKVSRRRSMSLFTSAGMFRRFEVFISAFLKSVLDCPCAATGDVPGGTSVRFEASSTRQNH